MFYSLYSVFRNDFFDFYNNYNKNIIFIFELEKKYSLKGG